MNSTTALPRTRRCALAPLLGVALLFGPVVLLTLPKVPTAEASTVLDLDSVGLARHANRVVHAVVSEVEGRRDSRGAIVTRYKLSVQECLKGPAVETFTVELPGGELDGLVSIIPGLSRFSVGDEVVLFLAQSGRGDRYVPVGLDQGVWRVHRTSDGGAHAVRTMRGLKRIQPKNPSRSTATAKDFPNRAPLAIFKGLAREAIRVAAAVEGDESKKTNSNEGSKSPRSSDRPGGRR